MFLFFLSFLFLKEVSLFLEGSYLLIYFKHYSKIEVEPMFT